MKLIKLIGMCTLIICILTAMFSCSIVNAAELTEATVTYGEIKDEGVEVKVKFSKDISDYDFDSKWEKENNTTIKRTFVQGAYAYVYAKDSNDNIEAGKIAVPVKLQKGEILNMASKEEGVTISNLSVKDTSIATVVDDLKIKAIKAGNTKIKGNVTFSNIPLQYEWDLTVVEKSEEKPTDDKQEEKTTNDNQTDDKQEEKTTNDNQTDDKQEEKTTNDNQTDDKQKEEKITDEKKTEEKTTEVKEESEKKNNLESSIWADFSNVSYVLNIVNDSYANVKLNGIKDIKGALAVYFSDKKENEEEVLNNYKKYYNKSSDFEWNTVDDKYTTSLSSKAYQLWKENKDIYIHIIQIAEGTNKDSLSALDFEKVKVVVASAKIEKKDTEDHTIADGKIPQTGINNTILLAIGVGTIVVIASIIGYKKYKNIK